MKKFWPYVGAALIITVLIGTTALVVQQSQRSEANYPQVQMAEDTAHVLQGKASPDGVVATKVAIEQSLAPFTIIYDKTGKPVAGSGYLNGSLPAIPKGVLTASEGKVYNAVTWQPQSGVRIAAVAVAVDNYYIVGGRSLREVERHEQTTMQLAAIGWLLAVAALGITYLFQTAPGGVAKTARKPAKLRPRKR